jgi:hypothetical protein
MISAKAVNSSVAAGNTIDMKFCPVLLGFAFLGFLG